MQAPWQSYADRSIAGQPLDREQARAVLTAAPDQLLGIVDAAYRVRRTFHGRKVHIHVLENAKLGGCPEDCGFCSQSAHFSTEAGEAPFKSVDELVAGARRAKAAGAYRYCMVTATHGPSRRDLDAICEAATRIKGELNISLCASLGFLSPDKASRLKEAGIDRFNHNLETGPGHFASVVSTHTFADRVNTVKIARAAGLETCSGGIIGMGETDDDVLDLAYALRELEADSVPVNFLDPRPGTPMGHLPRIAPQRALQVLAMFRFLHPRADLRLAGGREVCLRAAQPLALYIVNSIFTEGYLTTPGARARQDQEMIADLGFELELHGAEAAPPAPVRLPVLSGPGTTVAHPAQCKEGH
jgi:biotin synthase